MKEVCFRIFLFHFLFCQRGALQTDVLADSSCIFSAAQEIDWTKLLLLFAEKNTVFSSYCLSFTPPPPPPPFPSPVSSLLSCTRGVRGATVPPTYRHEVAWCCGWIHHSATPPTTVWQRRCDTVTRYPSRSGRAAINPKENHS